MTRLIRLHPGIAASFYALVAEYLPDSEPDVMRARSCLYPESFLAAMDSEQVVGVCFGWPRRLDQPDDPTFTLAGIAVPWSHQRQGIGSQLLTAFAQAAKDAGYAAVSVGSAGGHVETFYIHNGYTPIQYKIWENGTPCLVKTFAGMEDYAAYERPPGEGFVVLEKRLSADAKDSHFIMESQGVSP